AIDLNTTGHYVNWWIVSISVANLVVIGLMIVVFIAALLIPFFPRHQREGALPPEPEPAATPDETTYGWTGAVRRLAVRTLPPRKLLPDRQPAYVASWVYTFGVLTLCALGVVILSGTVIAIGGPSWWHTSSVGLFFNSVHLWSVELFFFFMAVHLWAQFWMAAWRGRRAMTWMTGAVAFSISIGAAFTGYLSQQNFDTQWIAFNAKDALNAVGIGAVFNVMDFGQMFVWHVVLLPALILGLVAVHLVMVRIRGVVPPIGTEAVAEAAPSADLAAEGRTDVHSSPDGATTTPAEVRS
ncbi:MAG TPA: cytochrome b N-terminal domain-containing protein, partial [Acidimicrobiales bacterium]|nr:cytochrome b N-terminal domain-containing protein [Acidimicrobiales bacterium]